MRFDLYGEGMDEEPKGVLTIDKESGTLYVNRAVDYEEKTVLKVRHRYQHEVTTSQPLSYKSPKKAYTLIRDAQSVKIIGIQKTKHTLYCSD